MATETSPASRRLEARPRRRAYGLLRDVRRALRRPLGAGLARLIGPRGYQARLDPAQLSSILVCRINGRLGNTLFLTPLLQTIRELLPHATIDLALAYPGAAELLAGFPGVRRIIQFPYKSSNLIGRYMSAVRAMRSCRYDLAIDPTPESTSGRAALVLCRARYRLGFASQFQWAPLTHAVPLPRELTHQAVHPVQMLCEALGAPCDASSVTLSLPLSAEEREAGRRRLLEAIGAQRVAGVDAAANSIGFFAHAAAAKALDADWWREFWRCFLQLEPDAIPVEFLPLGVDAALEEHFPRLSCRSPRALGAAIAATRMFISTDTGPMHLASCTPVPTVGLFRASDPRLYRPLKPSDLTIDVAHASPVEAARRCQLLWRQPAPRVVAP